MHSSLDAAKVITDASNYSFLAGLVWGGGGECVERLYVVRLHTCNVRSLGPVHGEFKQCLLQLIIILLYSQ